MKGGHSGGRERAASLYPIQLGKNLPLHELPPTLPFFSGQAELLDWHGSGVSVMEMSHRGKEYESIHHKAEADLRKLLNVPADYT